MNALRERELNNSLEQRLTEEKKLRGKQKKKFVRKTFFILKTVKQLFCHA